MDLAPSMRVCAVLAALTAAGAAPGPAAQAPAGGLAFALYGERGSCTAFYWRPVPGQPEEAYFLSAGHCWQDHYLKPADARVVWAKVPQNRPTFLDILIGETTDDRPTHTYPAEMLDVPKVGAVHVALIMKLVRGQPVFDRTRLTFRQDLAGDSYVYDADDCVSPSYSGSPVLAEDGRLVGVVILGDNRFCTRLYVFPVMVLYALRPDLRP